MKKILLLTGVTLIPYAFGAPADIADAAQNRDWKSLKTLSTNRANINATQPDGTTALQWAAHWNDLDAVKTLLAAGANPKLANRYGATPLSEACQLGNAALAEALLAAGADAKTLTTADGETVLMTAARSGNADIVKSLLVHGADANAKEAYRGQTALMWAAAEHHPEVVKVLLEKGADWKIVSQYRSAGMPKLSAASSVTPMSKGGLTALDFAAREGVVETARVMLDAGVDINQPDGDGVSPIAVAILNKRYTFAKYLLDRGADPNIQDSYGRTPLYALLDMRNEDYSAMPMHKEEDPMPSFDLLQALLDKGAKPNTAMTKPLPGRSGMDYGDTTLGSGATPLMRAARAGDTDAMKLLIAKGADPKLTTRDGSTALMFAAGVGYRDKNTKGTEAEALEALKYAMTWGQDINAANSKGETLLHGAALRGADTIVAYLIKNGAQVNAKMKQGFTPLDVAMGKSIVAQLPVPHESTVALIKSLGGLEGKEIKDPAKQAKP
jgi:ankyrin repeat protein